MSEDDKLLVDFKAIHDMLEQAREYGLEAEVVWSAMRHHTISSDISESCEIGLANWDI